MVNSTIKPATVRLEAPTLATAIVRAGRWLDGRDAVVTGVETAEDTSQRGNTWHVVTLALEWPQG
ncbi:hypothetical protein AB0J38_00215 [Streptomyces sp. NPDC050095]|uniref:hypothetical protein n=1 Tax=unclassified Streptomyces TaxID=2593676 RepID=UPI003421EF7A